MDPFTVALATFGVQKLRGKSTKRALRDAAIFAGGTQLAGMAGVGQNTMGAFAPQAFGQAAANPITGSTLGAQFGNTTIGKGITGALGKSKLTQSQAIDALKEKGFDTKDITAQMIKDTRAGSGEGFLGMGTFGKLATAGSLLPLLVGDDEPDKPPFTEEDYRKAYEEQSAKLEGAFVPATNTRPTMDETIRSDLFYANQGGLATAIPKFNKGGINYLPSKSDHDENDYNNYVRAEGYVEDGAGNGDKDKDTMLAQLADGEFVSRADAVLGAGILSGGDPKSYKSMRKAGADFFYGQQKQFKRIYDLVNENKSSSVQ
jgi:biotin operon repressor